MQTVAMWRLIWNQLKTTGLQKILADRNVVEIRDYISGVYLRKRHVSLAGYCKDDLTRHAAVQYGQMESVLKIVVIVVYYTISV